MCFLLGWRNVDMEIRQMRIERRFQVAVKNMLSQLRLVLPIMDGDGRTVGHECQMGRALAGRGRLVYPAVVY
jgi:hypothetical protein